MLLAGLLHSLCSTRRGICWGSVLGVKKQEVLGGVVRGTWGCVCRVFNQSETALCSEDVCIARIKRGLFPRPLLLRDLWALCQPPQLPISNTDVCQRWGRRMLFRGYLSL